MYFDAKKNTWEPRRLWTPSWGCPAQCGNVTMTTLQCDNDDNAIFIIAIIIILIRCHHCHSSPQQCPQARQRQALQFSAHSWLRISHSQGSPDRWIVILVLILPQLIAYFAFARFSWYIVIFIGLIQSILMLAKITSSVLPFLSTTWV